MSTESQTRQTIDQATRPTSPSHTWAPKKKRAFRGVGTIPLVDSTVTSSPTAKRDRNAARFDGRQFWSLANLRTSRLDKKPFKRNQDDAGDETLGEDFEGSTMVEKAEREVNRSKGLHESPSKKSSKRLPA